MRINPRLTSRLLVLPLLLVLGAGCQLTDAGFPSDQPATPVAPIEFVIEIVSDRATLSTADTTEFARLKVKAIRSIIWKFPENGTRIALKSNLGNFQSQSGPQTLTLELFEGVANTVFYGGDEPGIARLTATIGDELGILEIEIDDE